MATKSALIIAINGFITSVVNITKHRNSMLELVNELFPTTTTYTLSTGTNCFHYSLYFKKVGNTVYVEGTAQSKFPYSVESPTIFTIPDAIFRPSRNILFIAGAEYDAQKITPKNVFIGSSTGLMSLRLDSITENTTLFLNLTYTVND
jgi:hypothetical protein